MTVGVTGMGKCETGGGSRVVRGMVTWRVNTRRDQGIQHPEAARRFRQLGLKDELSRSLSRLIL